MNLEVHVFGCVDDGIDELEAGQLQDWVVGLLQSHENWLKPRYLAHLSVLCNSFQYSVMTERGRERERVRERERERESELYMYMYIRSLLLKMLN